MFWSIWFDILPSSGWDSLLLSAKQCSGMVEQKTKVFIAQKLFSSPQRRRRGARFLVKVSAPDFSFSSESCLLTCSLIAAGPRRLNFDSSRCISTFNYFLLWIWFQIKTLLVAPIREAENGAGHHKRSAIETFHWIVIWWGFHIVVVF